LFDPRLLVVAGPNGSGKSSIVSLTDIAKNYSENIINPDNYARTITDIEDYTERYIFAMKQCELLRHNLLETGVSFGFETVASTQEKIDFTNKAAAKGYMIDLLFVSLEGPELCYQRVQKRVETGGHDVERSKVFSRYDRTMNYLKEYIRIADTASIFDNSGKAPVLVFSKDDDAMNIIKDPSEIPWVERYIYTHYKDAERTLKISRKH
jgi:predicted ABC-type ATPase